MNAQQEKKLIHVQLAQVFLLRLQMEIISPVLTQLKFYMVLRTFFQLPILVYYFLSTADK